MIDFTAIVQEEIEADNSIPETMKLRLLERASQLKVEPISRSKNAVNEKSTTAIENTRQKNGYRKTTSPQR